MTLLVATDPNWISVVMGDFDRFLVDHALCERKASALAMSLVAHYPDKHDLVQHMVSLAIEELEHFQQVYNIILEKKLRLFADEKDEYVNKLRKKIRKSPDDYFLDRLLVAGIIEGRGTERFEIVAKKLDDPKLKEFYLEFWRAEARHHGLFIRLAKKYFDQDRVLKRYQELLEAEAQIITNLPLRPAVH